MPRSWFELGLVVFLVAGGLFPVRASRQRSSFHLRNSTAMAAFFVCGLDSLRLVVFGAVVASLVLLAAGRAGSESRVRRVLLPAGLRPPLAIARLLRDTVFLAVAVAVAGRVYSFTGTGLFPIPLARVRDLLAFVATNVTSPTVMAVLNEAYHRLFAERASQWRGAMKGPALLPTDAPLYRLMLVSGSSLQILAHVFYLAYGPAALMVVLGWFVLGIMVHGAFLRDRVQLQQAFRELEASQRILAMGEVTGRIVHQTRHQLGLIGIGTHLIREALKEAPVDRAKVLAQLARLDGVAAALRQMLSEDLGSRRAEEAAEEREDAARAAEPGVALRDLVQEEIERLQGKAEQLGVRLTLEADSAGFVFCDPAEAEQLGQGLFNVTENALSAARSRVSVRLQETDGVFTISVVDDGPGIPPELLPRAAEPFVTTKEDGSGMGLFIASEMARRWGGELALENLAEGGLRATFRLPTEPATGPSDPPARAERTRTTDSSAS